MSNSRFGFRTRKGEIRSFIEGNVAINLDADGQAFIDAAGITDNDQKFAISILVFSLKNKSLWDKFYAIYPFVGGTATTHKYNLKDPQDTNDAYRLSFVGGMSHNSNGITGNGTNGYANTFLNTSLINQTSCHLSIYSRTLAVGSAIEIGSANPVGAFPIVQLSVAGNIVFGAVANVFNFSTTNDARGFWIATKRANNDRKGYRNGISEVTSVANDATGFPNANIFIGARSNNATPVVYSNKNLAFASIGTGLTDQEANDFYTAVQDFQITLGRQI